MKCARKREMEMEKEGDGYGERPRREGSVLVGLFVSLSVSLTKNMS